MDKVYILRYHDTDGYSSNLGVFASEDLAKRQKASAEKMNQEFIKAGVCWYDIEELSLIKERSDVALYDQDFEEER